MQDRQSTNTTAVILSYLQPVISFFSSPLSTETPKKPQRKRSDFSSNKTASIALPDHPKKVICDIDVSANSDADTFFNTAWNKLCSLFYNQQAPVTKKTICKIPAAGTPIDQDMEKLEHSIRNSQDPAAIDTFLSKKIELCEHEIVEHAERRAQFFFYLLIAVYGKQVIVSKSSTILQHGRGSDEHGTQACHSSILTNVTLEPIPSVWSWFSASSTPSLQNTHLLESLNSTIELPRLVNDFDGHLEGRCQPTRFVKKCLEILNKAAKSELDPLQGMHEFYKVMQEFFIHFEKKYLLKNKSKTPLSFKKIWEYQKKGTFAGATNDTLMVSDDYLRILLFIKKNETIPKQLTHYYKQLQNEIYASVTVKKQKLASK